MDDRLVEPPSLAPPLRFQPFRARHLVAHRVGRPETVRLLSRPYREARRTLRRWERTGHLVPAPQPALYLHEYVVAGTTVRGLVGLLDVSHAADRDGARALLPHEAVHAAQVSSLGARMAALELNPAPILLVHRGPAPLRALVHDAISATPARAFVDAAGHEHRVWALTDPETLATVNTALSGSTPMIADGHHRFTAYAQLHRDDPRWALGLAMLVDQDDTPLALGPIHRVLVGVSQADALAAARGLGWQVRALTGPPGPRAALDAGELVVADSAGASLLTVPLPPGEAAVDLLHDQLLPELPGLRRVGYHHGADQAWAARRQGCAVLLPALDFDVVYDLVAHRRLLPEKATSFQPKPPVGVLMRSLRDEAGAPS